MAEAEEVSVTLAEVTRVRSVDEGFKTFVQNQKASVTTRSLEDGESFTVDVFELFTNEDKVNLEEPTPGDRFNHRIEAVVTLGRPLNRALTFLGNTRGEEDVSVVPAHLRPILAKENPTLQEGFLLVQWGAAHPELAKLAGGRGVVEWDDQDGQEVDLGDGRKFRVKLNDTFYNEGLQFGGAGPGFGTGSGNAGTVTATVTFTEQVTELGEPIIQQVLLVGDQLSVTFATVEGYTYVVETSFDAQEWTEVVDATAAGDGQERTVSVKTEGQKALFVRVIRRSAG